MGPWWLLTRILAQQYKKTNAYDQILRSKQGHHGMLWRSPKNETYSSNIYEFQNDLQWFQNMLVPPRNPKRAPRSILVEGKTAQLSQASLQINSDSTVSHVPFRFKKYVAFVLPSSCICSHAEECGRFVCRSESPAGWPRHPVCCMHPGRQQWWESPWDR